MRVLFDFFINIARWACVVGACVYEGYICGKSKEVKVLTDCICESSNVVFHSGSGLGKTHLIKHVRHKFSRKVKEG